MKKIQINYALLKNLFKYAEWTSFVLGAIAVIFYQFLGYSTWVNIALLLYCVGFAIMFTVEVFFLKDLHKVVQNDFDMGMAKELEDASEEEKKESFARYLRLNRGWSIFRLVISVLLFVLTLVVFILY